MVELRTVRAWHPDPLRGDPSERVCPVYDTLSDEEIRQYAAREHNAAQFVPRPRDVPLDQFVRGASAALAAARRARSYVRDAAPSYYVYGIRYVPPLDVAETIPAAARRSQYLLLGLVGALDLSRTDPTQVALHERTFADRVAERVALTEATGMAFAPILAGYHLPDHRLNDRLEQRLGLDRRGLAFEGTVPPTAEARIDGTIHRLWRVDDEGSVEDIRREVRGLRLLVLDGHHRFTAARHRLEHGRASAPLTMLVDGRDRALRVLPWHRILPRKAQEFATFLDSVRGEFPEVERVDGELTPSLVLHRLEQMHRLGRRGFLAVHGRELFEIGGPAGGDVGTDFDLLHSFLEERLELDPHDLLFRRSPRVVLEEIATHEAPGGGGIGLLLPALSEPGIEARAFGAGTVMAQKSTMFLPKVAEGMIFAPADAEEHAPPSG